MAPTVRKVAVRLMGDDAAAREVAEVLAMLPQLTQGRMQLDRLSEPYPMRRGEGVRYYVDAYLVDGATTTASPGTPRGSGRPARPALPPGRPARPSGRPELEA